MDTNQLDLKWTEHGQSVMKWIDYFVVNGKFTDVSLVAEGKLINAHRNILAACSPMLEVVLSNVKEKEPVLFFPGSHRDLVHVIAYVYKGEVRLFPREVPDFCRVLNTLGIRNAPKLEDILPHNVNSSSVGDVEYKRKSRSVSTDTHRSNVSIQEIIYPASGDQPGGNQDGRTFTIPSQSSLQNNVDGGECDRPLFLPCASLGQKPEINSSKPKNLRHRKRKKQQNIIENEEAKKKAVGFNYCTINSDLSMTVQSVDKAETAREQVSLGNFAPFSTPRRLFEEVSDDVSIPTVEAPSSSDVFYKQQGDIEHNSLSNRPQSRGRKRDRSVNKSRKSSKSPRLSPLVIRRSLRLKSRDRSLHRSLYGSDEEEDTTAAGSVLYCVMSNQLVEVQEFPNENEESGEETQLRRHRSRKLTERQPQKFKKIIEPNASFYSSQKLPHNAKNKVSEKDYHNDPDSSNDKNTQNTMKQDIEKLMGENLERGTSENDNLKKKIFNSCLSGSIKNDNPVSQKERSRSESVSLTEKSVGKIMISNEAETSACVEADTRLRNESSNVCNHNVSRSIKSNGSNLFYEKEKISVEKCLQKEKNSVKSKKSTEVDKTREKPIETETTSVAVNCTVPTKGMQKSYAISNSSILVSKKPPITSEETTTKDMKRAVSDKHPANNNDASLKKPAKKRSNASKGVPTQEGKNCNQVAMQPEEEPSGLVIEVTEQNSRASGLNDLLNRIKAAELAELKKELAKRYVEVTNRKNFPTTASEQKDSVTITRRRHVTEPPCGTKAKGEYANKSITETLRKWKSTKFEMCKVTSKTEIFTSGKNEAPNPRLNIFDWKDEIRLNNEPPQTRAKNKLAARGRAVARRGGLAKKGRETSKDYPSVSGKDDPAHLPLSHWKDELHMDNAFSHTRAQKTVSSEGRAVAKRGRPLAVKPVRVPQGLIYKPVYVKDTQNIFADVCSPDSLRLPASSLATNESPSLSDNSSQSKNLPANTNQRSESDKKGKAQAGSQISVEVKPPLILNRIRQKTVKNLSEPSASVGNSSCKEKIEIAACSSNEITGSCLKDLSFSSRKNNLCDISVSLLEIESRVLDASMQFKPSPSSSLVHSGRSGDSPTLSIRSCDLNLVSPLSSVRSTDAVVKSPLPCLRSPENNSAYAESPTSVSGKSPKNECQINEILAKSDRSQDFELSKKVFQLYENTQENSKEQLIPIPEASETPRENPKRSIVLFSGNDVNQYLSKLCDTSEEGQLGNIVTGAKNKEISSVNIGSLEVKCAKMKSLRVQKSGSEDQREENQPNASGPIKDMTCKFRSKSEPRLKISKIKPVKYQQHVQKNANPILSNLALSSRIPNDYVSEEKLALAGPQHKYIVDVESLSPFCESSSPPSPKTTSKNVQQVNVTFKDLKDSNESHEVGQSEAVEPETCSESIDIGNNTGKQYVPDSTSLSISGNFLKGSEMPSESLPKMPLVIPESSLREDQLSNPQPQKSVIDTLFDEIPRSLSPMSNIPSRVIIPRRSPYTEALIRIQRIHGLAEISDPLKYTRIIESSMVPADNKIRNSEAFVTPGLPIETKVVESGTLKEISVHSRKSACESLTDSCLIPALRRKNISAKVSGRRSASGFSEVSCTSGESNVSMQDITNLGEIFDLEALEKPTPGLEPRERLASLRKDNNKKTNFVISDDCPSGGVEIELDQGSCSSPKSSNSEMDRGTAASRDSFYELVDYIPLRKRRYSSSSVSALTKPRNMFMKNIAAKTSNKSSVLLPNTDVNSDEILDLEPLAKKVTEEILAKARKESQPVFAKKSKPVVDLTVESGKPSISGGNEEVQTPTSKRLLPDIFDENPANNASTERSASAILNATSELTMRSNVRSSMSDCTFEKQFRRASGKWVVKVERLSQIQVNRIQGTLKNHQKYMTSKIKSPSNTLDQIQDPMLSSVACDSVSLDETSNYKDFGKAISNDQPSGSSNTGKVVRGVQGAKSSQSRDSPGGPSEISVSPGRSLGLFEGTIGSSTAGLDWDFALDVSDLDLL